MTTFQRVQFSTFSSLGNLYLRTIDSVESRVGRVAANLLDLASPILISGCFIASSIAWTTGGDPSRLVNALSGVCIGTLSVLVRRYLNRCYLQEIAQIVTNSQGQRNRALFVFALTSEGDLKDGLSSLLYGVRSNMRRLSSTHSIEYVSVDSLLQFNEVIENQENQTLDFLQICAHGNQDVIYFDGKSDALYTPSDRLDTFVSHHRDPVQAKASVDRCFEASKSAMQRIGAKMRPRAKIVLHSCCTGKEERNIARTLSSHCPRGTVYAPSGRVSQVFLTNHSPQFFGFSPFRLPSVIYEKGQKVGTYK